MGNNPAEVHERIQRVGESRNMVYASTTWYDRHIRSRRILTT